METGKTPKACGQDSLVYSQRENLAQTWWREKAELEIVFDFHTCTEAGLCSHSIYTFYAHTHVLAFRREFLMGPFAA